MPVRLWVLSLPIPLRLLLVAQPKLVTLVLQVVQRVISAIYAATSLLARTLAAQGGALKVQAG